MPHSRILHPVAFLDGRQELQRGNYQCNIALPRQRVALIYHRKKVYRAYCTYRWSKHNLTWVAPSFPTLVYCLPQWSWIHWSCEKIFFVGTNDLVKFQIYSLTLISKYQSPTSALFISRSWWVSLGPSDHEHKLKLWRLQLTSNYKKIQVLRKRKWKIKKLT